MKPRIARAGRGHHPLVGDYHCHRLSVSEPFRRYDDQLFGDLLVVGRRAVDRHRLGLHSEEVQAEQLEIGGSHGRDGGGPRKPARLGIEAELDQITVHVYPEAPRVG
ncbi:MAG: hypothetical protein OXN93_03665 [bacterium]|nr:hypothetical protein [bacterium]